MSKPILLLDVDDTIANSTEHFAKCFEEHYKIPAIKENGFYMFSDKMIWLFNHNLSIWENIQIKKDFINIYLELDKFVDIKFISNRGMWKNALGITHLWLFMQLAESIRLNSLYISDNLDHKLELIRQIDWQIYVDDDYELLQRVPVKFGKQRIFCMYNDRDWHELFEVIKNAI